MSQDPSVRVMLTWRRYALLIALAIVPAMIAWAIRRDHVSFGGLQGLLQNHADDFSGVVLGTVLLLPVGRALGAVWRHWRKPPKEVGPATARLRLLAAPVLATAAQLWVEFGQRTGGPFVIYPRPHGVWEGLSTFAAHYLDGTFDPADVAIIVLAGLVCTVCVVTAGRTAGTVSTPRHGRVWRLLSAIVIVGAVAAATTAGAGGSGGSSCSCNPSSGQSAKEWPEPVVTLSGNQDAGVSISGGLPGGFPPGADSAKLSVRLLFRATDEGPWATVTRNGAWEGNLSSQQTTLNFTRAGMWRGEFRAQAEIEFTTKDGQTFTTSSQSNILKDEYLSGQSGG